MNIKFKFIPLLIIGLSSCSYTPNAINPFSDDAYRPIGMNAEFSIARSASAEELYILQSTIDNSIKYSINSLSMKLESRNYTLSRTGVFKNGYDLYDEKISYQNDIEIYKNDVCVSKTIEESTKHYDFANENSSVKIDEYLVKSETPNVLGFYDVASTIKTTENNSEPSITYDETFDSFNPLLTSFSEVCGLSQNTILNNLNSPIGVDIQNELIFASESNIPYDTKGIFTNKSGEQFRAMTNSFIIAKLSKLEIGDEGNQIYLINYFRRYNETILTSKPIQPNARIEYLEKPILINYEEAIVSFDIDNDLMETDFNKNLIPTTN